MCKELFISSGPKSKHISVFMSEARKHKCFYFWSAMLLRIFVLTGRKKIKLSHDTDEWRVPPNNLRHIEFKDVSHVKFQVQMCFYIFKLYFLNLAENWLKLYSFWDISSVKCNKFTFISLENWKPSTVRYTDTHLFGRFHM